MQKFNPQDQANCWWWTINWEEFIQWENCDRRTAVPLKCSSECDKDRKCLCNICDHQREVFVFYCCTEEQEQEKKGAPEKVSELGPSIRKKNQLTIFPSPLRTIFTFSKIRAIWEAASCFSSSPSPTTTSLVHPTHKKLEPFQNHFHKKHSCNSWGSITHSLTHQALKHSWASKTNNSSFAPKQKKLIPRKKDFGSIFYHRTNLGAGEPKVKEEAEPTIHELCFFFSFLPFCFFFSFWLLGCQPKQAAFWCACMQWKIRGEWGHMFVQCCNPSFLTDWISSLQPKCMGYLP